MIKNTHLFTLIFCFITLTNKVIAEPDLHNSKERIMTNPCYFKVDKLVRDHILLGKGVITHEQVLTPDDFIAELKKKLVEEAHEVAYAKTQKELTEELADIMEVIHTLAKACEIPLEKIEYMRVKKNIDRGGFEERKYSSFVTLDSTNTEIQYYLDRPDKYPEITAEQAQDLINGKTDER